MANIITITTYCDEPRSWHRCEWECSTGMRRLRYETDVDLTIVLRNLAAAGECARRDARRSLEMPDDHLTTVADVADLNAKLDEAVQAVVALRFRLSFLSEYVQQLRAERENNAAWIATLLEERGQDAPALLASHTEMVAKIARLQLRVAELEAGGGA